MTFNRKFFLCAAVLSVIPLAWTSPRTKPAPDRQVVSIPAEGVDVAEMLLVADSAHSLLFLNFPRTQSVQVLEVTDTSRPMELKAFQYGGRIAGGPFHLIEHVPELLGFASAGRDSIGHPHTISLVDLSSKIDQHGAASVKGMCDYITDAHRAVTYALCEHNLTVIRTSEDNDAGERL